MRIIAWPAHSSRQFNPYTSLLYKHIEEEDIYVYEFSNKLAISEKFDILHVHWPEAMLIRVTNPFLAFFYVIKFLISVTVLKSRGTKIVWTVHNLKPHETNFFMLRKLYFRWFSLSVDGIIALSKASIDLLFEQYPALIKKPFRVTFHGHYRDVYPNCESRDEARKKLSLSNDQVVLLFLGQVRPYKNIHGLISVFKEIEDPNLTLLIAGLPNSSELKSTIQELCSSDTRINLNLDFICDQDLQVFFNATDLVILPYQEILNSGTALLSLSFDKPVVVPDKGAMAELQKVVGSEWIYTYEENFSSSTLTNCINWLHNTHRDTQAPLQDLDWKNIARETVNLYQEIFNGY